MAGPGLAIRDSEFASAARPKPRTPSPKPQRITNVVFMGMGEPLANYAEVMKAVRILRNNVSLSGNLGWRRLISTDLKLVRT